MYGESVFTTMRMINGSFQDWEFHFERLVKGIDFLYGPFTEQEDWKMVLKNRLEDKMQDLQGDKVTRIAIYREQTRGLLRIGLLSVSDLRIQMSHSALDHERYENKLIKLRTCPVIKRPQWWPSYLKAGNYLETIMSQKMFMKPGDDDILFLSDEDTVLESSIANIFVVRHNKLYTAPSGPNVLEGVMRRKLITVAVDYFDEVYESKTTMEQLLKADAVIGTNSVRGLFLIDRIDDYEIIYSEEFLDKFKRLKDRVFL
jgi:branched-subunit amino acid aminotransferase/4-amino-4-deoxychorismate lyase